MSESTAATNGLWEGEDIELIGVAGEYASGKTLFGVQIAPDEGDTLILDFEKSSGAYERHFKFDRIDMIKRVKERKNDYKPIDLFVEFISVIKSQAKKYKVIILDPVTEVEEGLVAYVEAAPEEFGLTAAQITGAKGLMWGAMKTAWKKILADIATQCETVVFTAHMKQVWAGDRPTKDRAPKGKSTLFELASLYLLLERPKDREGRQKAQPSAVVLKSRLAHTTTNGHGELVIAPILPPRLKVATPKAIREYIKNPPDYTKLKAGEKAPEREMSDDERQLLEAEIAENTRLAAESKLESAKIAAAVDAGQNPFLSPGTPAAAPEPEAVDIPPDPSAAPFEPTPEPEPAPEPVAEPEPTVKVHSIDGDKVTKTEVPVSEIFGTPTPEVIDPGEVTLDVGCDPPEADVDDTLSPASLEAAADEPSFLTEADLGAGAEEEPAADNRCTPAQIKKLKKLRTQIGIEETIWEDILARRGVSIAVDLTEDYAEELIGKMLDMCS